jgi:hypothetical protein
VNRIIKKNKRLYLSGEMKVITGSVLLIIFLFLALLHIYWGAGGKWGIAASIPTKKDGKKLIDPGPLACFIVASGLLVFAFFISIKTQLILFNIPGWLLNSGLWIIAAIFLLRAIGEFKYIGFFKKITSTPFGKMDTKYYSPLCLLIGLSIIILQLIN